MSNDLLLFQIMRITYFFSHGFIIIFLETEFLSTPTRCSVGCCHYEM